MAYLAFDEFGAAQRYVDVAADAGADARLSPLEWAVVVLARGDTLDSLREPGRLAVALGTLFGRRPNPRLADPRLEALRRLAVRTWRGGAAVPTREMEDFFAAGFTAAHYGTVQASIRASRFSKAQRA